MEWHEFDTRVAAYAVIVDENARVLLALWNGPEVPRWTMPGGGVELDERPQDAAVRELREETGYEIRVGALLGIDVEVIAPADRFSAAGRPLKAVRVVYRAEVTGGRLTNEVDGSTDEARWVPLAEVPELRRVPLVDTAIDLWRASARAPRLVVLAGRPGTGKTTLARRLADALCGAHLRVDTVETALLGGGMASPGVVGYRIVHGLAAETLAAGTTVVVDAVNPVPEARAGWRELARECGCEVAVFETALHDQRLHRARVEARRPDLAGQRVPTWDQVRSVEYVPWDERRDGPRVVIDMTETDVGVARALASLG